MNDEQDTGPTDSHRFFRATPEVYEGMRQWLDAEWGHPKPGTQTCVPPLAQAPQKDGYVWVSASNEECAKAGDVLEALIDADVIEEWERSDWEAATAQPEEAAPPATVRLYLCDDLDQAHDISLNMEVTIWRDFDGPNGTRYAVEVPDHLTEYYPETITGDILVRENGQFISGNWEPFTP